MLAVNETNWNLLKSILSQRLQFRACATGGNAIVCLGVFLRLANKVFQCKDKDVRPGAPRDGSQSGYDPSVFVSLYLLLALPFCKCWRPHIHTGKVFPAALRSESLPATSSALKSVHMLILKQLKLEESTA